MSLTVETYAPNTPASAAVASTEATVLFQLRAPGTRLAIWQRCPPPRWATLTAPLLAAGPFSAVAEDEPEAAVDRVLAALPVPTPALLLKDMRMLAALFGLVAACPTMRVRLEGVTDDACTRWHADAVPMRLLCTYRGPGTEWLPGDDHDAAPNTVGAPCVALFKGRGFPGDRDGGLLHRSPCLSHLPPSRRARLLLCIDVPGHFPL